MSAPFRELHLLRRQVQLQRSWLDAFLSNRGGVCFSALRNAHGGRSAPSSQTSVLPQRTYATANYPALKRLKNLPGQRRRATKFNNLERAIRIKDIAEIEQEYGQLSPTEKQAMAWTVFESLVKSVRTIHNVERLRPEDKRNRSVIDHCLAVADRISGDMRNYDLGRRRLPLHILLTIYTEASAWEGGNTLWAWLRQQDDAVITSQIYSAGIRLLAAQDNDLTEIEEIYQEALARFPAGFVQYHFSPGAVLPDRDQESGGTLDTLPTSLLTSIMIARLQRGDTKHAYLALDTLLRLNPHAPALQKDLVHLVSERPLTEAWAVFALVCRANVGPSNLMLRTIIGSIRSMAAQDNVSDHMWTLRAMLSIAHMQVSAGGTLIHNVASEILIAITQIMRVDSVDALPSDDRQLLASAVYQVYEAVSILFVRLGAKPSLSVYNSAITNLGGFGRQRHLIELSLEHAEALGHRPTMTTYRSILAAAGQLADSELIASSWKSLSEERARLNQYPDTADAHILTKAAILADNPKLVHIVLKEMTHLNISDVDYLAERVASYPEGPTVKTSSSIDIGDILAHVGKLNEDVSVFEQRTEDAESIDRLAVTGMLPMALAPTPEEIKLSEPELERLYDEMTTDPTSAAASATVPTEEDTSTAMRQAGSVVTRRNSTVPIGRLRYENWKTITYLLALAAKTDGEYADLVDQAIAAGTRPPKRTMAGSLWDLEQVPVGLSDFKERAEKADRIANVADGGVEDMHAAVGYGAREKIIDLRRA